VERVLKSVFCGKEFHVFTTRCLNKNLAIANRSRGNCAHNTSRVPMITPWP